MLFLLLLLVFASPVAAQYGGYLLTDQGVTSVRVTNTGSRGGTKIVPLAIGALERARVQFSIAGLPRDAYLAQGTPTTTACPGNPCGVSMNLDYGDPAYYYTVRNAADSATIRQTSMMYMAHTDAACSTAPFTVPIPLLGFRNTTDCWTVSLGSLSGVTAPYVWIKASNLRNGGSAQIGVNGTWHPLNTLDIGPTSCNGSSCSFGTMFPHHLTAGTLVRLNGFTDGIGNSASGNQGDAELNGLYTVLASPAPTTYTFAVASTLPPVDWNAYFGTEPSAFRGKTVSATSFCDGESAYLGCLDNDHSMIDLMVPLGGSELQGSATNTLSLRFTGDKNPELDGVFHGYNVHDVEILTSFGISMTQIVVSGDCNATATLSTTRPADWTINKTIHLRGAPGPYWRFNGKRVITATPSTNQVSFACGPDHAGETAGVAPYTTANGTYTLPTSADPTIAPSPVMYAALALIPKSDYQYWLYANDTAPGGNAANGETIWKTGALIDPAAPYTTIASCASCHTESGIEMKTGGFSTRSLIVAGMHRSLREDQAIDVATYIKSLPYPTPPRCLPWNPPYQPMPGIDSLPIDQWSCGGGWEWGVVGDWSMKEWMVPGGSYANWAVLTGTLPVREIPIPFMLRIWNQWFPHISMEDFYARSLNPHSFHSSPMWAAYQAALAAIPEPVALVGALNSSATSATFSAAFQCTNGDDLMLNDSDEYLGSVTGCGTTSLGFTRHARSSSATTHTSGSMLSDFTKYVATEFGAFWEGGTFKLGLQAYDLSRTALGGVFKAGDQWPNTYGIDHAAMYNWSITKSFEIHKQFLAENFLDQTVRTALGNPNARAAAMVKRGHAPSIYFMSGPHVIDMKSLGYMNRYARNERNWDVQSAVQYHAQPIFNAGNRMVGSNIPIDPNYYDGFNNNLSKWRSSYWMQQMGTAFFGQHTVGIPTLANAGQNCITIQGFAAALTMFDRFGNLLASESADQPGTANAKADQLIEMIGAYSVTDWQNYLNNVGSTGCGNASSLTSNPVLPGSAWAQGGNFADSVAELIAILGHYGVSTAKVNAIVSWANLVWVASGHDFATNKHTSNGGSITCSFDSEISYRLRCTNIP